MAESICRAIRDGALQGEHAPALTIKDSSASPFGFHVFTHLLTQLSSNILAAKSQSRSVTTACFKVHKRRRISLSFTLFEKIEKNKNRFQCDRSGLVLVAFSRSPSFYLDLLNRKGIDVASSQKW